MTLGTVTLGTVTLGAVTLGAVDLGAVTLGAVTPLVILLLVTLGVIYHLFFWTPLDLSRYYPSRPLWIAHRGALHRAPENTLAAYHKALEANMPALEIDVVHTRDSKIVCSHNYDLERETDGYGYIHHQDYDQIRTLNAAAKWAPQVESIPLLEEVLEVIPAKVRLNIEVKVTGWRDVRTAMRVARMVKHHRWQERVIISSFNPFTIWAVKWIDATIPTGFILETWDYFFLTNLVHPDCLHPTAELLTRDLIRYARNRRLALNVWTVNTRPAIEWLVRQGVDGIITDYPEYCSLPTV